MIKRVSIMLVILALTALSGCQSGTSGAVSDLEGSAVETSSPTIPSQKTELSRETTISTAPSEGTASAPYSSATNAPGSPPSGEPAVTNSHTDFSAEPSRTTSQETSAEPAPTGSSASSTSETEMKPEPSESQDQKPSPEDGLIPGKQYNAPADDPYGVVTIIRSYAEERGFVLNESLTIENSGYRGHPNVTDWTLEGVIDTLKYHVDKLLEINGASYYNVVYRVFQEKLEYYFLVR